MGTPVYIGKSMREAQSKLAWYTLVVAGHGLELMKRYERSQLPPRLVEDLEHLREVKAKYAYAQQYREGAIDPKDIPEEMVGRFAVAGKPEDCVEKIKALENIGVKHLSVYTWVQDKANATLSFGEKIIPYFR